MSRGRIGGVGRRVSLLTSSSFVATIVASGLGGVTATTLLPSVAFAVPAAACSQAAGSYAAPAASAGGVITCGPATTGSIGYTSDAVDTTISITGNTHLNDGGVSLTSAGAQNLGVVVVAGATRGLLDATTQPTEDGIHVQSAGGNVVADTQGFAVIGGANGVSAQTTGAGTVTVINTGGAITGNASDGILATTTGTGTVNVGSANAAITGAVTGAINGVEASGQGAVNVFTGGDVTGTADFGILADSPNGPVTVNATGGTITAGGVGILALSSGDVTVTNSDTIKAGADVGIVAVSQGGNVSVADNGAITAGSAGILGSANGTGTVTIVQTTGASIVSTNGNGIRANTQDGAISITQVGDITAAQGNGVRAVSTGSGSITIASSGNITAGGSGAVVRSVGGGSGTVNVALEGNVTSGGDGIRAFSNGTGSLTVGYGDLGGTQTLSSANGQGIHAVSLNSDVTVNVGQIGNTGQTTINAPGQGIHAVSGTNATVNLGDKVTIDPDNYGVFAASAGTTTVTSGDHDTIVVDDNLVAGNDDKNYGVFAASSAAADVPSNPSVNVQLGTNNSITVKDSGDGQADGGLGIAAINTGAGTGSVRVTVGDGLNISVTGNNAGGIGAATNFGGGSGSGNVTVITGTGSITVTGGANTGDTANNFPGSFGIAAQTNGGNVAITTAAAIAVSNNVDAVTPDTTVGILGSTNGGGTVTIIQNTGASIVSANGDGIQAEAVDGAISVTQVGAISAKDNGVEATSTGSGSIAIASSGNIRAGGSGALVRSLGGGSGTVSVALEGNVASAGDGIHAFSNGTGSLTVGYGDLGGTQTLSSANGQGIHAVSLNSDVTVNVGQIGNTGQTTITAPGEGIHAFSGTNTTVNLGDKVTIDPDNYGVFAASAGTTTVTSGAHDTIVVDDNLVAGNDDKNYGVFASSAAAADAPSGPSVNVALGANNAITIKDTGDGQADGGLGIAAINTGSGNGGVQVQVGNGVNISVTGNNAGGIGASTVFGGGSGEGNVTVHTGTGSITVTGGAAATDTANNFPFSFGIGALTQGAGAVDVNTAANITVSNNAPTNNAAAGVFAAAFGSGTVSVTTSGAINVLGTNSIGVGAFSGSGSAVVNINGAVTSGGQAAIVSSETTGAVTIGAAGSLRGKGDTANDAVLTVITGTGTASLTTVTNKGLIASNSATTLLQAGDYAIQGVGGSLVVANNAGGTIRGKIDVSQLTSVGTGTAFVTVNNAGTWNVAGAETLTAGNDTINNSGTINTAGATTFDLGAGTNTFTNSGTIVVGGAGAAQAAASLTIANVPVINNSGVIDVHDGAGNRSFTTAAKLNGTGAATLYDDAFLGAPGSTASAVTIGGSTGLTSIRVNNTNLGGVGAYIPDPANGIVLVTGATALNNFQLSPLSTGANGPGLPSGATNAISAPGMFFYDLAANGNNIVLISAPKVAAFQFAQVGAIAGDTWYTTTQSWFERQADLRDTLDGRGEGSSPAVWMKIVGDWSRRDSSESLVVAGKTYGYDTSYRGDTTAVIAGVDLLHGAGKDTAWVVGVQGGYVDANERFRNSSTRLNLTGGVVGVYASYLKGGLFVDGIVNGDILTGDWNLPSLGVGAAPWDASSHVNTWGAQLESGYAFPIGTSSSIEPLGSIAYGRTTTGHLGLALGDSQAFGNSDTLRGSLGGRVATTAAFQYYKVKLALEARVWDEFDGKTTTALTDGGAPFLNANDISGVYGEVKGEANLFAVGNNLSAFVDTGIKWKTRYQDTSVSLGVRYQW